MLRMWFTKKKHETVRIIGAVNVSVTMIRNILKRIHILVNSQKSSVADPEPKLKEPGLKFKCLPEPDPKMKNWRSSSFLFIKEIFRIRNTAANFLKDSF